MTQINCHIPIKLRLTGHLTDEQLDRLGEQISQAIAGQLAAAERVIATGHNGLGLVGQVEVREAYNPARAGPLAGDYTVPSYNNHGQGARLPVRSDLRGRPWSIRRAINFHAPVGAFLDFIADLNPAEAPPGTDAYFDMFEDLRWVSLWLVQVNRAYLFHELKQVLAQRAVELSRLRDNQVLYYGMGVTEEVRQSLITLDQDNVVAREVPEIRGNAGLLETVARNLGEQLAGTGEIRLRPGALVLFAGMVLPKIELSDVASEGAEIQVPLRLRELAFLVPPPLFENRHGVAWEAYTGEFGDETTSVRILPLTVTRPVHAIALECLAEVRMGQMLSSASALGPEAVWYGRLFVLNNSVIQSLPPAIRHHAESLSTAETRRLGETEVWDLGLGARAAYMAVVLTIGVEQIHAARYRPAARRHAVELIALLQRDSGESEWGWDMLHFFQNHYGEAPAETREPGGPAFEYLLAELEARGSFDRFYDQVEANGRYDLLSILVRHSLSTRYAAHARILRALRELNARFAAGLRHTYRDAEQEIWIDHDSRRSVPARSLVFYANSIYTIKTDAQRIRAEKLPEFRRVMNEEAQALFRRILSGEETGEFDEAGFTRKVLGNTLEKIHLSENDIENITIERTARLLRIAPYTREAVTRYRITFEFAERINDGPWETVPESETTLSELDFEMMLWNWSFRKTAAIIEGFAIGVSIVAVVVMAWEGGLIGLLLQAAGGAGPVLVAVTVSELVYLVRVIFGNARWSLRNFLMTALEGYLIALTFNGAGFVGRTLAARIGTATMRQLIGGWVLERLAVGALGGAGSAALITFSHDLIRFASGQGGWSSVRDYIRNMGYGLLFGVVFEFGVGALAPILRAGGRSGLETLAEAAASVREAGFSPARWTALTAEALGKMRSKLGEVIISARAGELTQLFGERLAQVSELLGETYRMAVFRRVLELAPESLTRGSVEGLEKFLSLSRVDLTNQAALDILNSLNPAQLRGFLEALNTLDAPLIRSLSRAQQLRPLSTTPEAILTIGLDPTLSTLIRSTLDLTAEAAAARAGALARFAQGLPLLPETVTQGAEVARGGTNVIYEVSGHSDLLVKSARRRSRLPAEAQGLVDLELLGIDTVYSGTRQSGSQLQIIMPRINGVGSKDIIGRLRSPMRPYQNTEVVTQRTIDDLRRIYRVLEQNHANVGDFQFIVRRSDGAVFVNDPVSVTVGGSAPSGDISSIIQRFERILRDNQATGR
jgi:hypothetical protein